ncbi:MAG TPA: hypothetical protein VNL91_10070 [Thermoanaerobaculia bacterium]|nr:hypothetical protein [Thermoanaerobaculia bacterium]
MSGATELKFEGAIEAWLLERGGYAKGDPKTFDVALGLDPGDRQSCAALLQESDHPLLLLDERVDPRRLGVEEVGDLSLNRDRREWDPLVQQIDRGEVLDGREVRDVVDCLKRQREQVGEESLVE